MGFSGSVFVINDDDFKLDIPHLETALRERWSEVEFQRMIADDIDFDLFPGSGSLDFAGVIFKQKQIAWWGSYGSFAEFLLWFRKYVSGEFQLMAIGGDGYGSILLQPNTTKAEIIAGLEDDPK